MSRVRVLRLIEYIGEREWVEETTKRSLHGTKVLDRGQIVGVTIGEFPEELGLVGWQGTVPDTKSLVEIDRLREIERCARALLNDKKLSVYGSTSLDYRQLAEALGLGL
jgi:hypothetical protein